MLFVFLSRLRLLKRSVTNIGCNLFVIPRVWALNTTVHFGDCFCVTWVNSFLVNFVHFVFILLFFLDYSWFFVEMSGLIKSCFSCFHFGLNLNLWFDYGLILRSIGVVSFKHSQAVLVLESELFFIMNSRVIYLRTLIVTAEPHHQACEQTYCHTRCWN